MTKRVKIDLVAWPEVRVMLAEVIKAREAAGLTQTQAAKILGTGQSYVAALEGGFTNPSFQLLAQMARAYKVPMTAFVPDKVYNKRPNAPRGRTPTPKATDAPADGESSDKE
ncbi:helix-turn-helix transcriptional regulator [Brevundimonas vesicularis]|jgi:transcriptional regulator with XRE-family HTH domain|uniref:helix-turn-helix domain-containing protein n=1 Tax=Brevundimonas vesicularis TaxID=41276 RepID=UPI00157383A0|nr:helix-turn-helix transcriptional regulator [Brevundimonas vesicularis]NSX34475.1 helix-turn-helix transcriptional regulator [Brevundimonas vesicularis]